MKAVVLVQIQGQEMQNKMNREECPLEALYIKWEQWFLSSGWQFAKSNVLVAGGIVRSALILYFILISHRWRTKSWCKTYNSPCPFLYHMWWQLSDYTCPGVDIYIYICIAHVIVISIFTVVSSSLQRRTSSYSTWERLVPDAWWWTASNVQLVVTTHYWSQHSCSLRLYMGHTFFVFFSIILCSMFTTIGLFILEPKIFYLTSFSYSVKVLISHASPTLQKMNEHSIWEGIFWQDSLCRGDLHFASKNLVFSGLELWDVVVL